MESFIRYLYEYKDEQRVRNVGFVKVDQGEEGGTLQIHGRGTFLNNADIRVYLVYMEGKRCRGILMGQLEHVQSILSCRLVYDREEIEPYADLEELRGIMLETNGQGTYAAVWDEGVLPLDQMEPAVPREERPSMGKDMASEESVEAEVSEILEACAEEGVIEKEPGMDAGEEEKEEPGTGAEEEEKEEPGTGVEEEGKEEPEAVAEEQSEESNENRQEQRYCKIMREDMKKLPQKNWYLANNSFLLHGYYNYRHLLLITDEGKRYLGVPGIYHRREEAAARSFGFSEFCRIPEDSIILSPQECDRENDFGYWCRELEGE